MPFFCLGMLLSAYHHNCRWDQGSLLRIMEGMGEENMLVGQEWEWEKKGNLVPWGICRVAE